MNSILNHNKFLLVLVGLVLLQIQILAQDELPHSTINEGDVILLEHEQGIFWRFDPFTGERVMLFQYDPPMGQILDFDIEPTNDLLYILESAGCCGGVTAGRSQIARVNLETGEVAIVFEGRNFLEVEHVPNSDLLTVGFYDPALTRIRDERLYYCLLDPSTQICGDEFEFGDYDRIRWVNSSQYIADIRVIASIGDSYLVTLNNDTVAHTILPIFAPYWVSIPNSDHLLASSGSSYGTLSILNLETLETSRYKVAGDFDPLRRFFFYPVSLSTDGTYLIVRYEDSYLLIDFASEEILTQFDNIGYIHWIDDQNILLLYSPELGHYPKELTRYNTLSGERVVVTSFSSRTWISIVQQ